MKKIPLSFCLVLFLAVFASAQTNQSASCPTIDVSSGGIVAPGEPMSFTVDVEGYDLSKLSFDWAITTGEIIDGQGTSSIKVLKKNDDGKNIVAIVSIKGLPERCPASAAETEPIICNFNPKPTLFDAFGGTTNDEIRAFMDAFFVELGNLPNAQGYIINYGTNREISRREAQLRNHIAFKKYDASRVTFVRGGAKPADEPGVWTKFWLVPPGAAPPEL